ncbi:type IV pilus twitching motility protein PilT [Radiobacillus sp. PE A8.2]|uniref:type IV pilus twitching motility protein PilT n=1 Tax=Radiobacillus sp. PE A8.2 TaxID=3380349 RepID=UPI00388F61FA
MKHIEDLLIKAFEMQASDLHITIGTPPVLRIHGELQAFGEEALRPKDTEEMARAILKDWQWEKLVEEKEIDLAYGIKGVSRFRVNIYHQRNNISLAIRTIPAKIPTLEELQTPEVLKKIAGVNQGLVLVTGPTGSGKSTTLAAIIDYMNKQMARHIITLEDPIEYLHSHNKCIINQREVGFDTNSFANGLRASLRQDPDVILVGEMRDLETISTAITAAETGHLVLGTLHTTDAASTMERIIDVFPADQKGQIRVQLANVLEAIVSQRLYQTVDGRGRRVAMEILRNTAPIKNLIRNDKMHQIASFMQTSKEQGMQTMKMSITELLKQRVIAEEVMISYTNN